MTWPKTLGDVEQHVVGAAKVPAEVADANAEPVERLDKQLVAGRRVREPSREPLQPDVDRVLWHADRDERLAQQLQPLDREAKPLRYLSDRGAERSGVTNDRAERPAASQGDDRIAQVEDAADCRTDAAVEAANLAPGPLDRAFLSAKGGGGLRCSVQELRVSTPQIDIKTA